MSSPELERLVGESHANDLRDNIELVDGIYPKFDKKIYFDHPNFSERKSMFEMYLKDIIIPTELSYAILSDRTAGMTGADIANIANQSKINAIQRGQEEVGLTDSDIQIAIDENLEGTDESSILEKIGYQMI